MLYVKFQQHLGNLSEKNGLESKFDHFLEQRWPPIGHLGSDFEILRKGIMGSYPEHVYQVSIGYHERLPRTMRHKFASFVILGYDL